MCTDGDTTFTLFFYYPNFYRYLSLSDTTFPPLSRGPMRHAVIDLPLLAGEGHGPPPPLYVTLVTLGLGSSGVGLELNLHFVSGRRGEAIESMSIYILSPVSVARQ